MSLEILKVLYVGNDAKEHAAIRALLGEVKTVAYEIVWGRTAEEGWRLAGAGPHDACLIAYRLAGDSGINLIRRACAEGLATGPMILVTDTVNEQLDIEAMAAGAADILETDVLAAATLDRAIRYAIQRRRIMEDLKEKEARLNLALSAANFGFWDWNPATGGLYVTPEYRRMLGYGENEKIFSRHTDWLDAVHPDDRGFIDQILKRLRDGEKPTSSSFYRLRGKDGAYRWIQSRATAVYDEHHRLVRVFGINVDMTEQKLTEERLREQAAVLDQANDAIVVRDLDHRVIYCNPSAARTIGLNPEDIVGHTAREVGGFPPQYDQACQQVMQNGEWHGEMTIKRRDGSSILADTRWTLLRDDAGRPKAVLAIYSDVSERKRLESQYLRAQRMESIGMLAGGIAHDLNNVLAPIVMATQLLRLRFPDAESQKLLGTVEASAQRGAELVRQVLTFARGLEGQRLLVHPKSLVRDVEHLISETVDKSIEVVSQIEPDLWPVPGDPTQLHQVLMNLCINARDAMPQGGRLRLAIRNVRVDEQYAAMSQELRPGLYVLFEVQDTGLGIPPEIRERIFEPFFSTKQPGKGTGLGLSTARTIVKNHDGFISLESEMGRGTTFRIFLPASLETATARGTAAPIPPPRGSGETILVVDDEASILSITRHALELYGYQALTASNGAEALALFAQKRGAIAAVLTDMAMPVLDGAALIYALRKIDPNVKIIAASGLKSTVQSMEPFGLGTTAFLAKPFTAETMLHAIHAALVSRVLPKGAPAVAAGA
ncbi:MAG TPA: PAS domain S-box protein [Opitutaceae bacterium]|nr:PAS domain S-box protein [Opitutaceae bacterium]